MLKREAIQSIEEIIGYEFKDKSLLSQAFTRSSYHYEHPEDQDNEVLEFIGDSVLSLIVVNALCERYTGKDGSGQYSTLDEGDLSALKSSLVNKANLAKQMSKLCLQQYLRMSIGDERQNVKNNKSVMEDLFESIVGAVYLDSNKNMKIAGKVVTNMLDLEKFFKENDGEIHISYKNDVQEWCQRYGYDLPTYDTHPTFDGFLSYCEIEELDIARQGEGRNKKEAENEAARKMSEALEKRAEPKNNALNVTFENPINMLQEYCQAEDIARPIYETIDDEVFEDNSHNFTVRCSLKGYYTDGEGSKVKEAKKQAAYKMLQFLGIVNE
ncbi:MAG: hypothetical protein K5753_05045 [Clostridia bacterium]|nr:hypothetical protein [Clostridia bacterium]